MWETIMNDFILRHSMYYAIACVVLYLFFPIWAYLFIFILKAYLVVHEHKYKFLTACIILFIIIGYMSMDKPKETNKLNEIITYRGDMV